MTHPARELPDKLDALWKANWKVSVLDAQSVQTPYVSSSAELKQELAHKGQTHRSINLAAARLTRFIGRRAFFGDAAWSTTGLRNDCGGAVARISVHHVGGDPWKQEFAAGYAVAGSNSISSTSSNEAVSMVDGNSDAPLFVRVRYRETEDRTFGGEIRDALRDGYGYYDLTVTMPADVRRLEIAVDISAPVGGTYSIYAQPYVAQGRSPELSLVGAKR